MTDESQRERIDVGSIASNQWFPNLFSPLKVGPITLKNRMVNAAHQTGFAHNGSYTSQLRAYHRERARGGAARSLPPLVSTGPTILLNSLTRAVRVTTRVPRRIFTRHPRLRRY
jgi:hypothetical protein